MVCAHRRWVTAGVWALILSHGALQAAPIDPEAEKVLREMTTYTQALKSFRTELTANYTIETSSGGKPTKVAFTYSIAGEQPNRLATIARAGEGAPIVVSDGKQLYTLVPALGKYVLGDAPASFREIVASEPLKGTSLAHALFAGTLLSMASYDDLTATLEEARYIGEEKVGLVRCQHLKLSQKDYDWDAWIDIGKRPMLRKLVPDLSKWLKANPAAVPPEAKVELSIVFKSWATDVALRDKDFKIEPSASARQVASFTAPAGSDDGPETLKGKAAPLFSLALLGGGTANLAAHQGKDVVMLDFWATWCGPCVAALPQVAEVAAAYRSRGVVFYAVNLREDSATIQQFLQEKQLPIPVALDADGSVAGQYKARAIPQTVIVGRDGTVQVVHVGAGANIKDQLSADLDAVLAAAGPAKPTTNRKK